MKCYILEWLVFDAVSRDRLLIVEYFKHEMLAISRQKEIENMARNLRIPEFTTKIKEIIVKE